MWGYTSEQNEARHQAQTLAAEAQNIPEEPTTAEIIAAMLKENTGEHFLDSGMALNRSWQQNQLRDFQDEDAATICFSHDYIEYTKNVFHFLCEALEYNPDLNAMLDKMAEEDAEANEKYDLMSWNELRDQFHVWLNKQEKYEGLVCFEMTVNTYNNEDALSQVILYTQFTIDSVQYVALQIHGGADVRGGYTAPRIFALTDEYSLAFNADGSISCENDHYWQTDDTSNWYEDGSSAGINLEMYPIIDVDDMISDMSDQIGTVELDDFLTGTVADLLSQSTLSESIAEYTERYKHAAINTDKYGKAEDEEKHRKALNVLIYRRLLELNEDTDTLQLDLGGKDKVSILKDEVDYYQRIIDRIKRRKAEIGVDDKIFHANRPWIYTTKPRLIYIMEKHNSQRQRVIRNEERKIAEYHAARSFILSQDGHGFCPICQTTLTAY